MKGGAWTAAEAALIAAIQALERAQADGQIRNVVFKEAKQELARAFSLAWTFHVQVPFFYAGGFANQPQAVSDLEDQIGVPEFHRSAKLLERINASGLTGDAVDAMRAVAEEASQLTALVNDVKPLVVMSNRVLTDEERLARAQAENPDKTIRTCACCFRGIAVTPSLLMAHHGYKRPGEGLQTASCMGIAYKPLEVSSAGLEAVITRLKSQRDANERALLTAHELTSLRRTVRLPRGRVSSEDVPNTHKDWPALLARHMAGLAHQNQMIELQIIELDQRLAIWAPKETDQQLLDARLKFASGDADDNGEEDNQEGAQSAPAP